VEKGGGKVWIVARHSAAAFLGVPELAGRYLPTGKGEGRQQVERFAREVRRRVVRWRKRIDMAEGIKEAAKVANGEGWVSRVEQVEWDTEVALVVVKWANGTEARCRIDEKGEIVKAVVMERKGKRLVEDERTMKGSLSGLPGRLRWDGEE